MSSVSNGLYFLTLPLVSVMRVIHRKIRHALYLYTKRNIEKFGVRVMYRKIRYILFLFRRNACIKRLQKKKRSPLDMCTLPLHGLHDVQRQGQACKGIFSIDVLCRQSKIQYAQPYFAISTKKKKKQQT